MLYPTNTAKGLSFVSYMDSTNIVYCYVKQDLN